MPLAKREWFDPLFRHAVVAAGLGLLFGFLGPFGTYPALGRGQRYAFWFALVVSGYVCALLVRRLLPSNLAHRPLPARVGATALLSALPQTFVVAWAFTLVQPGRQFGPAALAALFVAVVAVQLILVSAVALAQPAGTVARLDPATEEKRNAAPADRGRVSAAAGGDVIALEAEDHYVRVHTDRGSALVLHRLVDSIAELAGIDGLQVHRGWWVASGSVRGTFMRDGRRWLRLTNGLEVPVSRARVRDVLARGWPAIDAPAQ